MVLVPVATADTNSADSFRNEKVGSLLRISSFLVGTTRQIQQHI